MGLAIAILLVGLLPPLRSHAAVAPEDSLVTDVTSLQNLAAVIAAWEESLRTPWYHAHLDSAPADSVRIFLIGVDASGMPIYKQTLNVDAARTIRTDLLWPGGSSGLNLTGANDWGALAIWDAGHAYPGHSDLDGRLRLPLFEQAIEPYVAHPHSTHCAGTMMGLGVMNDPEHDKQSRGMSNAAFFYSYNWTSDLSEMAALAAVPSVAVGGLPSNHSYGTWCGWNYNNPYGEPSTCWWNGDLTVSMVED